LKGAKKNDKRPIEWSELTNEDYNQVKQALINYTTLSYPDANKNLSIWTDASDYALGAILQQDAGDGIFEPISFFSKKLNKAQTSYSTYDREL
jgi:hypothetical protein